MKKLFTNKQKFIYYFILYTLLIFGFILLYKYYQSSVHIKITPEEVEYIMISDIEEGKTEFLDMQRTAEIIELFNDMKHIKRDFNGNGSGKYPAFEIKLKNGELLTLFVIGTQKWNVIVEGRPWQWIDYWGAPDYEYWDIVSYIGEQTEWRQLYTELIVEFFS